MRYWTARLMGHDGALSLQPAALCSEVFGLRKLQLRIVLRGANRLLMVLAMRHAEPNARVQHDHCKRRSKGLERNCDPGADEAGPGGRSEMSMGNIDGRTHGRQASAIVSPV